VVRITDLARRRASIPSKGADSEKHPQQPQQPQRPDEDRHSLETAVSGLSRFTPGSQPSPAFRLSLSSTCPPKELDLRTRAQDVCRTVRNNESLEVVVVPTATTQRSDPGVRAAVQDDDDVILVL